jgi:hypothetical protein
MMPFTSVVAFSIAVLAASIASFAAVFSTSDDYAVGITLGCMADGSWRLTEFF